MSGQLVPITSTQDEKNKRFNKRFRLLILGLILIALITVLWLYMRPPIQTQVSEQYYTYTMTPVSNVAVDPNLLTDGSITFKKIDPVVWENIKSNLAVHATRNVFATTTITNNLLTGNYVAPSDVVSIGDLAGSYDLGFDVTADAVDLGADTVGQYITTITAGPGLTGDASGEGVAATLAIGAGDGITVAADSIAVNIQPGGGLGVAGGELGLTATCADGGLLKWNALATTWDCGLDNTAAPSLIVREADGSSSVGSLTILEFGPISTSSDEFIVTDNGGGVARVRLGTQVPLINTTALISATWTFANEIIANAGLACVDCLLLGTETSGNYIASLVAGGGVTITGAASEGATPTIGLDSSLAIFKTIATSSGAGPVADSLTDTLTLAGGNGLLVTGNAGSDTVTFDTALASGSGLAFSGGALTLQVCTDGEILKRVSGSWACSGGNTTNATSAYKQQLAGTDNVTVTSTLTPLLTDGSGTAQSQGITISTGNEVGATVTIQISSTIAAGPATYVIIRDDNHDNDCATGSGDGTQIGGQVSGYIATAAQSFTTSFTFVDTAPTTTTQYYQVCASTTIGLGTTSVTNRSLILHELNL